jgi:hypothetical protein
MNLRLSCLFLSVAFALASAPDISCADEPAPRHIVDLRDQHAFEQLERSNPAHFKKLEEIIAALREHPKRAEGDWLQVNFDARDVDLSRYLFKTSYPPKQLLRFTLEDTRYILDVTRYDLVATVMTMEDSTVKTSP